MVRFIAQHVSSIEQLEVLLLLREQRTRDWSAAEVTRELRSAETSIAGRLAELAARHLIAADAQQPPRYRAADPDTDTATVLDQLAADYRQRRLAVINAIYAPRPGPIRSFADAFRLAKPPEEH